MQDQKELNHRERVKQAAIDGINDVIARLVGSYGDPESAKIVYKLREDIADTLLYRVRRHFTIRPRVRK